MATLALTAAAMAIGQAKGANPLSVVELSRHAWSRLFAGGIHHVHPDLDDD